MKTIILFFIALIPTFLFAQSNDPFIGDWEPNKSSSIASVKIKLSEDGVYKVKLTDCNGKDMITKAKMSDGSLIADFEEETNYGDYWVDPASQKIMVAKGNGRAGSYGEATGWSNGNTNYSKTNSRYNSANIEENHFCIRLTPANGNLKLEIKLYSVYCKGPDPMFYQSSNWVSHGVTLSNW